MSDLGTNDATVFFFLIPLGVAIFAFWAWMLADCLRNEAFTGRERRFWLIVLIVLQPVGALLYYFQQYRPRRLAGVSGPKPA
jgi:Phospholipase_D-nuclease N-terminal